MNEESDMPMRTTVVDISSSMDAIGIEQVLVDMKHNSLVNNYIIEMG